MLPLTIMQIALAVDRYGRGHLSTCLLGDTRREPHAVSTPSSDVLLITAMICNIQADAQYESPDDDLLERVLRCFAVECMCTPDGTAPAAVEQPGALTEAELKSLEVSGVVLGREGQTDRSDSLVPA